MILPPIPRRAAAIAAALASTLAGCGGEGSPGAATATASVPADPVDVARAEALAADADAFRAVQAALSDLIDEVSQQYHPIVYEYDEDLLARVDRAEARLRGEAYPSDAESPDRLIPGIGLDEEDDHLRQTIRRWSEQTGGDFRAEIDRLKAERAAVDPAQAFHPEFHRSFAKVFDAFIPLEVAEIRERRNRALRARAAGLIGPHRESRPEFARYVEAVLDQPQFRAPDDPRTAP